MTLIQGISGVRGIVGESLTNKILSSHVQAFSTIQDKGTILIARDSRTHGKALIDIATQSIADCGRNVQNFNIIPTPTAQFLVEKNNLAGGIVITASHNPEQWNGLKFIDADGCFLDDKKNKKIFKLAKGNLKKLKYKGNITSIKDGFIPHIKHTLNLSSIDINLIKRRKFTVVIDAVNGAASEALPKMLQSLGCTVHRLYCNPNGQFSRGAEPLPNNLTKLRKMVIEKKADLGFATDPDGDRLAVIDETGNSIGEEYTLVFCVDGYLKSTKSNEKIVTNLSTTLAVDKVAKKYGNNVIKTAVGEINVVNKMKELNSCLGGEGNGGIIFSESHLGRDSLVGATLFLNRLVQENKTVSQIFNSMPQFYILKDKIELNNINAIDAIKKIKQNYPKVKKDEQDGLKLIWGNSWIHIRKSNTEPIIRIYSEAQSKNEAKELIDKIKNII